MNATKKNLLIDVKTALERFGAAERALQTLQGEQVETGKRQSELAGTVDLNDKEGLMELCRLRVIESLFPSRVDSLVDQVEASAAELLERCNALIMDSLIPGLNEEMKQEEARLAEEFGDQAMAALRISKRASEIRTRMGVATVRMVERERLGAHARALIDMAER